MPSSYPRVSVHEIAASAGVLAGVRMISKMPPIQTCQLEQVDCLRCTANLAMQLQPALGSPSAGPSLAPARFEARAGLGILQRLPPLLEGCMGCRAVAVVHLAPAVEGLWRLLQLLWGRRGPLHCNHVQQKTAWLMICQADQQQEAPLPSPLCPPVQADAPALSKLQKQQQESKPATTEPVTRCETEHLPCPLGCAAVWLLRHKLHHTQVCCCHAWFIRQVCTDAAVGR